MFKMTNTRLDHSQTMFVAIINGQLVVNRTSRLTAVIPALSAISTQSANGKNASEAITAPFRSKLNETAFSIACFRESTREVYPIPLAQSCLFFTSVIALDLLFFTILLANNKSSTSGAVGFFSVIGSRSASP